MGKKWKLVLPIALFILLLCTVCASAACSHKWKLEGVLGGDCQSRDVEVYRCTVCGATKNVEVGTIDPNNHDCEVCTKRAIAPTCTTAGCTAEYRCGDCGKILQASVPIPAKGHVGKVTKAPKAATCTTAGWTVNVVCQNCGVTLSASKPIPAKGHVGKVTKAPKAATCTTAGWTVNVVCQNCGVTLSASKAIPKLGHSKKTKSVDTNLLQDYCERCGMLFDHVYIDENAYPKNFAASNVSNGIKLTWSAVTNANRGYTIYRDGKMIANSITGLSYTDTSVSNGTQYTYKICAQYGDYNGTCSWGSRTNRVSKTYVYVSRPSKVTGTATKLTAASVSGATGYQIQVVDSASKSVYNTTATTNTRTISALKAGTYKIRARAYRTVSGVKYWSAWTAYTTFKVSSTATK